MAFDFILDPHQALQQRFGTRGTARHVNVDRHDQVHAFDNVIAVLEIGSAADGAGAHGNHKLGIGHQVVQPADTTGHFVGDRPGNDHQVGLPRSGSKGPGPKTVHVKPAGPGGHHLDGTTSQAEGHGP